MAVTPTRFAAQALTTSSVTLYTAPASTRAVLKRLSVINTGATAATVTLTLTPAGGSPVIVTPATSVAAGTPLVLNEWANMVLQPGDAFAALASAAGVNLSASGFIVS